MIVWDFGNCFSIFRANIPNSHTTVRIQNLSCNSRLYSIRKSYLSCTYPIDSGMHIQSRGVILVLCERHLPRAPRKSPQNARKKTSILHSTSHNYTQFYSSVTKHSHQKSGTQETHMTYISPKMNTINENYLNIPQVATEIYNEIEKINIFAEFSQFFLKKRTWRLLWNMFLRELLRPFIYLYFSNAGYFLWETWNLFFGYCLFLVHVFLDESFALFPRTSSKGEQFVSIWYISMLRDTSNKSEYLCFSS